MAKKNTAAAAEEAQVENTNDPAAVNAGAETKGPPKSVVPAKYAGRYKKDGEAYNKPLAVFIRAQCGEGDKFEFPAFFSLCRINGIAEEQVAKYEAQVATKANGVNGRARMTLANMLRSIARKNQTLKDLSGNEQPVPEAKAALSGAAAAQAGNADPAPAGSEAGSAPEAEATASEQTE